MARIIDEVVEVGLLYCLFVRRRFLLHVARLYLIKQAGDRSRAVVCLVSSRLHRSNWMYIKYRYGMHRLEAERSRKC